MRRRSLTCVNAACSLFPYCAWCAVDSLCFALLCSALLPFFPARLMTMGRRLLSQLCNTLVHTCCSTVAERMPVTHGNSRTSLETSKSKPNEEQCCIISRTHWEISRHQEVGGRGLTSLKHLLVLLLLSNSHARQPSRLTTLDVKIVRTGRRCGKISVVVVLIVVVVVIADAAAVHGCETGCAGMACAARFAREVEVDG